MSGRTRVAVVVDRISDYQVPVIRGAESVLHAAGAALLVVISHPLHSRKDTTLRRLVRAGQLHGVVITAMRDHSTHLNRVTEVVALTEGIPAVTIGVRQPGVPVVLSENAGGIRAAMAHLLDDCGRRHPLLLAGIIDNDDSREREAAYRELAAERRLDLPHDPVVHAQFDREIAYRGVIERLAAGRDFDSVIAANDDMAFGVLDALHERGVRVPEDVALVGFDNVAQAYLTSPPLTTVDIELEEQGKAAARLVLAQLDGGSVPDSVRPAATLVVRHTTTSGTATLAAAAQASDSAEPAAERVLAALATLTGPVETEFEKRLQRLAVEWVPRIIDGTMTPRRGGDLGRELEELVVSHPEPLWWRNLTATVRAALTAASPGGRLNAVTEAGILRMTLYIERALASVREQRDRDVLALSEHVLELNRALAGCRTLPELAREVSAYLPRLNIRRCFVVLLDRHTDRGAGGAAVDGDDEDVVHGRARVVMNYRDGDVVADHDRTSFSIDRLLPPSLSAELEHGTLTVQPLFTADRWFGIVMHEQSVIDRHTAEALRLDVSRVLDAIARAKEMTERASELEALVSVRTEQLELEVASRRAAQESLHEANLELRRALLVDGLTELQNRPSFDEHLARAWHQHLRSGEQLSVLMVDVDHFKRYNDTYGHLAGDTCLREVAHCLQAAVSRKQDIVARYGGEEFAVILPDTDARGAELVALRLLKSLRAAAIPHVSSDHHQVSVSIGVASTSTPGTDSLETLLELADQAMYAAKRNGRDRVEGHGTLSGSGQGGPA